MSLEKYLEALDNGTTFTDVVYERELTKAELEKREEIAQAIEREHPEYDVDKKMAIATAKAKECCDEGFADTYHATKLKVEKEKLRKRGMVDQAEKLTLDDIKKKYPVAVREETLEENSWIDARSCYDGPGKGQEMKKMSEAEHVDAINHHKTQMHQLNTGTHKYSKMYDKRELQDKYHYHAHKASLHKDALDYHQMYNEETMMESAISVGDFVKCQYGKTHRVFKKDGTTLHVGEYYGDNKYGGSKMIHTTKVSKVSAPKGISEEKDTSALDAMDAKEKRKEKIRNYIMNQSPVKIKRVPGKPEVKEEVELVESTDFHAKPTTSGAKHYALVDYDNDKKSGYGTRKDGHKYVGMAGYQKGDDKPLKSSNNLRKSGLIVKHKDTGKYAVGNISDKTEWHDKVEDAVAHAHKRFRMDHQHVTPQHVKVLSSKDYRDYVNKPVSEELQ